MKIILLFFSATIFCTDVKSQTFAEWFSQKKTQKKYLFQQIAALQVNTGYLNQGYQIAKAGLGVINNFKNGEFNLHDTYFTSLKTVSPIVRGDSKVAAIIAMQTDLLQRSRRIPVTAKNIHQYSQQETDYIGRVLSGVTQACMNDITDLTDILQPGKLQLGDNERMERIQQLYKSTEEKYVFVQSLEATIEARGAMQNHEKQERLEFQQLSNKKIP